MSLCPGLFAADQYRLPHGTLRILQQDQADHLAGSLIQMDPWLTLEYTRTALRNYLQREDPGLHRFAVEYEGMPAGTLCVRYPWLLGPYVELLAVLPASQGQGLGREVLVWLEQEVLPASRNLWALVSSFNSRARRFYQSCGFVEVVELPDMVKKGFNEVLLRKRLGVSP
jgi:GNAT superfamily N-acetyltransferase